jgi:hypothetical protein
MALVSRIVGVLLLALAVASAPETAWLAGAHATAPPCAPVAGHAGHPGGMGERHAPRQPDLVCAAWCAVQCIALVVPAAGDGAPRSSPGSLRIALPDDAAGGGLNPEPDPPPPRSPA